MEPDLDRLLDFESHGGLFPQFGSVWKDAYSQAKGAVSKVVTEVNGRKRVAILARHPLSFASLFLAFAREEVDLFLFNPTWGSQELNTAREIADCDFEISDNQPGVFAIRELSSLRSPEKVTIGRNPLRVMIATGGSSGRIRFAIHDWSTLAAAAYGFQQHMSCKRMAGHCVLPLYHVSGFMQLIRALLTMGSVVFGKTDSFSEEFALLANMRQEDRFLSLVATQLQRLLRDKSNIARLKEYGAIFLGGGPAPISLLERARELRLPLAPTYGMTETAAQIATLKPEAFLAGELNQGRPLPHAQLQIVDPDDPDRELGRGEVGLIRIYTASLFHGYFGGGRGAASYSYLTSDLGRLDQRGFLTVMGRVDRVLISGGEKINPREIETVFEKTGLVKDVFCFGREDNEWGQALCVAYVPQDVAVTESVLREVLSKELSGFKVPKQWILLEEIPRNEAGKPKLSDIQSKMMVRNLNG